MSKKLPEIFHNNIDKKLTNNKDVFYSVKDNDKIDSIDNKTVINNKKSIRQKINEIFASSSYVYKANVVIKTKDNTINKRIIGRNSKFLITMDNDKIDIDSIIDIEIEKWVICFITHFIIFDFLFF